MRSLRREYGNAALEAELVAMAPDERTGEKKLRRLGCHDSGGADDILYSKYGLSPGISTVERN
jgi:hypothetical protein